MYSCTTVAEPADVQLHNCCRADSRVLLLLVAISFLATCSAPYVHSPAKAVSAVYFTTSCVTWATELQSHGQHMGNMIAVTWATHGPHGCRANFRVLSLLVGISALAACNALYVPLRLEQVIHTHPRSRALLQAAEADGWLQDVSNITASGIVSAYMTIFCHSHSAAQSHV